MGVRGVDGQSNTVGEDGEKNQVLKWRGELVKDCTHKVDMVIYNQIHL